MTEHELALIELIARLAFDEVESGRFTPAPQPEPVTEEAA